MQLLAKDLLAERGDDLLSIRTSIESTPGMALVWVGEDEQTAAFIRAKQVVAKKLNCQFWLHHFMTANQNQIEALILGLNRRKDVDGIVLQLPLPENLNLSKVISLIDDKKDIDNLKETDIYRSPTPTGIIELLIHHKNEVKNLKTVILGDGRLVGRPLAKIFTQKGWNFSQINSNAQNQASEIKKANLLISCTGVKDLIEPSMVSMEMIVIDGSGVDVDVDQIEPLVKAITPKKGAIGPLTVSILFENLLKAASSDSSVKK